jgi:hypothetical protein
MNRIVVAVFLVCLFMALAGAVTGEIEPSEVAEITGAGVILSLAVISVSLWMFVSVVVFIVGKIK